MLQPKHLAIVRAALTFWDEEMAGADKSLFQHYLHVQDAGVEFGADDVLASRQFFNSVTLRPTTELDISLPAGSVLLVPVSGE